MLFNIWNYRYTGDITKWYDLVFQHQIPNDIYIRPNSEMFKSLKVPGCLMDDPEYQMSIPLIDFDINKNIKTIIQTSKEGNGSRKPVCGIVRGMGGGKTRAFEEMRRQLLQKEGMAGIFVLMQFFSLLVHFNDFYLTSYLRLSILIFTVLWIRRIYYCSFIWWG